MIAFICSALEDPGDQVYMLEIYREFKYLMFSVAGKYVSDPLDCEDIVQDSLVKLIDKMDRLREVGRCALPAYIAAVVRNTAINHLEHQAVTGRHSHPFDGQILADSLELGDMAQLLHHKERMSGMWAALTPEERFLLEGRYVIGYSDQELAKCLKCKASSVRMKLTRARRRAFRALKRQEEGETVEQA